MKPTMPTDMRDDGEGRSDFVSGVSTLQLSVLADLFSHFVHLLFPFCFFAYHTAQPEGRFRLRLHLSKSWRQFWVAWAFFYLYAIGLQASDASVGDGGVLYILGTRVIYWRPFSAS